MLILNLVVFAICIWIRFDLDFRRWVWDMGWYTFWYCTYVNMVASIFAAASCIVGLYGLFYVRDNWVRDKSCIFCKAKARQGQPKFKGAERCFL